MLHGEDVETGSIPFLFEMATSQSPSLLRTLTTAYNPGMHLLVLPVIGDKPSLHK